MTHERELGWEDEIEKDGGGFITLPAGDYNFTVAKFERGRFTPGPTSKLPPCNEAKLELKIDGGEHGEVVVFHRLFLHTSTEGFLSNFFTGIGQKVKGEKLRMNWNLVVGARGRCKIIINKYTDKNGNEQTNNQVDTFYEPTAPTQPTYQQPTQPAYQQPVAQPYQQPPAQPTYQQPAPPTQQAPFPTQPTNAPPVVPGQF